MPERVLGSERVLGIDPGSRITGYGIIDVAGGTARYVASGAVTTAKGPFTSRLADIYSGVADVIAEHAPTTLAIEEVFFARNPQSALKLGQARVSRSPPQSRRRSMSTSTHRVWSSSQWSAAVVPARRRCSTWCGRFSASTPNPRRTPRTRLQSPSAT